jgi:hypothetical protein
MPRISLAIPLNCATALVFDSGLLLTHPPSIRQLISLDPLYRKVCNLVTPSYENAQ